MERVKVSTAARHEDTPMLQLRNMLDLPPEAVAKIVRRLPKQRAVGPDEIASEIWIACGDRLAVRAPEACRHEWNHPTTMEGWHDSTKGKVTPQLAIRIAGCFLPTMQVCDQRPPTDSADACEGVPRLV